MTTPESTTPRVRAALRDASFSRRPARNHIPSYHVVREAGPENMGACGEFLAAVEGFAPARDLTIDAETVPLSMRCGRTGCKARWPKPLEASSSSGSLGALQADSNKHLGTNPESSAQPPTTASVRIGVQVVPLLRLLARKILGNTAEGLHDAPLEAVLPAEFQSLKKALIYFAGCTLAGTTAEVAEKRLANLSNDDERDLEGESADVVEALVQLLGALRSVNLPSEPSGGLLAELLELPAIGWPLIHYEVLAMFAFSVTQVQEERIRAIIEERSAKRSAVILWKFTGARFTGVRYGLKSKSISAPDLRLRDSSTRPASATLKDQCEALLLQADAIAVFFKDFADRVIVQLGQEAAVRTFPA